MAEHISLLAGNFNNFNNIKECFSQNRSHKFCVDCLERKSFDEDLCQLCRPFYSIPDNGFKGYSRECLMEKLVDLHQSFVECTSCVDENKIDIPLVEKFVLGAVPEDYEVFFAWLDNKIYVTHSSFNGVRVFADRTPFTEFPKRINMSELCFPCGMVASTSSNSILISDDEPSCIWKIQLPDHKISRIDACPGAEHLSITPDDELLVVAALGSLFNIFSLKDFSRTNSIEIPDYCFEIHCAAQMPNKNIIFSYTELEDPEDTCIICIMTSEGDVVQKFDPNMFEYFQRFPWQPSFFTTNDAGQLFISDSNYGRLFVFNSQMTDFHIVSNFKSEIHEVPRIVYMKGRQQLLVSDENSEGVVSLCVFHLSPCNLIRERNNEVIIPASNKSQFKRKRRANKFSTWNFQKLGLKKRRY